VQEQRLTLEDLSAAIGMTARNVRAYQTKGLIPPPGRQGRRSVYGVEHLRRLQAIERARARGASLSLIASHLAEGNALDDDTLVGWQSPPDRGGSEAERRPVRSRRSEIGTLLAGLDHQRDPVAQARVEELLAAGVFVQEGRRVYTGRDLATAMTALQRQGLPVAIALGVAQRAMTAALPVAEAVRESVDGFGAVTASATSHLREVAVCVVRHVVSGQPAGPPPGRSARQRGHQLDLDR
jgi:DNA-binding transcriptional MerR regulator